MVERGWWGKAARFIVAGKPKDREWPRTKYVSPFPLITCALLVSQQRHPIMNLSRDPSVN